MTCDQPVKISNDAQSTAINTLLPAVPAFLLSFESTRLLRLFDTTFGPTLLSLPPDPPPRGNDFAGIPQRAAVTTAATSDRRSRKEVPQRQHGPSASSPENKDTWRRKWN
ncbi:hypothetical protein Q1695_014330 [Nippostrongylus brasiliensis]|nr:hypothetical protein Q1695_014330 [Nippostrongylus brasiliensis]